MYKIKCAPFFERTSPIGRVLAVLYKTSEHHQPRDQVRGWKKLFASVFVLPSQKICAAFAQAGFSARIIADGQLPASNRLRA